MNVYMHEYVYEWMYEYMHETFMTVWQYITWLNKTGQVRWEVDQQSQYRHLATSLGMISLEMNQITVGVNPVNQTTDGGKTHNHTTEEVKAH